MDAIIADKVFRGIAAGMSDNAQLGLQEREMDLREKQAAMTQKIQDLDLRIKAGQLDVQDAIKQAKIEAERLGLQAHAEQSRGIIGRERAAQNIQPILAQQAEIQANIGLGDAQQDQALAGTRRTTKAIQADRALQTATDEAKRPTAPAQQQAADDAAYGAIAAKYDRYQLVKRQLQGWQRSGTPPEAADQMALQLSRLVDSGMVEAFQLAEAGDYLGAEEAAAKRGFIIARGSLAPSRTGDGSYEFTRPDGSTDVITADQVDAMRAMLAPVPVISDQDWRRRTEQREKTGAVIKAAEAKAAAEAEKTQQKAAEQQDRGARAGYRNLVDALDKAQTQLSLALSNKANLMPMVPELKKRVELLNRLVSEAEQRMGQAPDATNGTAAQAPAPDEGVIGASPKTTGAFDYLKWLMEATPATDQTAGQDAESDEE